MTAHHQTEIENKLALDTGSIAADIVADREASLEQYSIIEAYLKE